MLVTKFLLGASLLLSSLYSAHSAPTVEESTQEVETRQIAEAAEAVAAAVEIAINIFDSLSDAIQQDNLNRGQFTQDVVGKMYENNPKFSYIIVHTKHSINFGGERGKDWDHRHQEFDIKVGGTIGYEIYSVREGTFTLEGDGGYINWAFTGNIVRGGDDNKTLTIKRT